MIANLCILIIAHPGANLDSLLAVLPALFPDVELCQATGDADALISLKEKQPHLAIIDSEIGYPRARLIYEMITTQFPTVQIIVLSGAAHWQRWKNISESHQVLLKGFSTRRLKATLIKALSSSEQFEILPRI